MEQDGLDLRPLFGGNEFIACTQLQFEKWAESCDSTLLRITAAIATHCCGLKDRANSLRRRCSLPRGAETVTLAIWDRFSGHLRRLQSGNDDEFHCRLSQNLKNKTN